jgi:hypothetical protein
MNEVGDSDTDVQELTPWAQEYAQEFYRHCRTSFFLFFDNLAGDDIRLRQELMLSTLTNPTLIRRYQHEASHNFWKIGEYLNFSSLLGGPCDAHHRDLSPVANLFYASPAEDTELNLLLGMQLLWLLDYCSGSRLQPQVARKYLSAVGHVHNDIEAALGYFEHKEIFTVTRDSGGIEREYFINRNSVDSYLHLAGCLSYLDNMAMVTPVSAEARAHISRTTGSTHFKERKLSTLAFLDEIRRVEARYLEDLHRGTPPSLIEFIGQARLPSVFLTLRDRYAINDHEQRKKGKVSQVLTRAEWSELAEKLDEINRASAAIFDNYEPWEAHKRGLSQA